VILLQAAFEENPDEHEIIFSAQKGDSEAIEYLLKKYKRIVLACARHYYLPGAEKEDLIQEGMIALYHAVIGYNFKHPFPSFAKVCIDRKMCTAVRLYMGQKHAVLSSAVFLERPVYEDKAETFLDRVSDKNTDPCDLVARKDDRNEILELVQKNLSQFEKQSLELYCNGLQYQEIADVLGVKTKSVDNALQRAKRKLRSAAYSDRENY
jgi:RNA polymerase sporulation-specific sigma factor